MAFLEFLTPDGALPQLRAPGKKQALQALATHAAQLTKLDERTVFDALLQRERLGSTGIGDGIAIPHGKLPGLDHLCGVVARMEQPIDFDALDNQPVDIIFLLLAPEGAGADHLKALARVARLLRAPSIVERIRAARDAAALYAVMAEEPTPRAA